MSDEECLQQQQGGWLIHLQQVCNNPPSQPATTYGALLDPSALCSNPPARFALYWTLDTGHLTTGWQVVQKRTCLHSPFSSPYTCLESRIIIREWGHRLIFHTPDHQLTGCAKKRTPWTCLHSAFFCSFTCPACKATNLTRQHKLNAALSFF